MNEGTETRRHSVQATLVALFLTAAIDLLTNSIDTHRFSWDFRYYADMAENGLGEDLASPFAYRYLIPLLVRGLSLAIGLRTEAGFALMAYLGVFTQLLGVFMFTRWYTRSIRGAWLAMLVTAFSLFNVKFLLFDPFRPDSLAYSLILLAAYFALSGRFLPLVAVTIIGSQIREFTIVPWAAHLYASFRSAGASTNGEGRRRRSAELVISIAALGAAIILPRVLIPVVEDFQFAGFSRDGVLRPLLAPFIPARDANFVYSIMAYCLPVLMLAGPGTLRRVAGMISRVDRHFFGAYTVLVLALSFLGGVDFFRFSTYLFLPQIVLVGLLADGTPTVRWGIMLASLFVFNRVWLPFPMSDQGAYLDFYGGYGTRFNDSSLWRIAELLLWAGIGQLSGRLLRGGRLKPADRSP